MGHINNEDSTDLKNLSFSYVNSCSSIVLMHCSLVLGVSISEFFFYLVLQQLRGKKGAISFLVSTVYDLNIQSAFWLALSSLIFVTCCSRLCKMVNQS
jgi:hypothetical protein